MHNNYNFDKSILREYDIRGVYGKTLNDQDAYFVGRSYGSVITKKFSNPRIVVGYDGRVSSPALVKKLIEGLPDSGVNVINIGLATTPMTYYAVFDLNTHGGIEVTGSHNPSHHNGFKMMLGKKSFFGKDIKNLGKIAASGNFSEVTKGSEETLDIADKYVDRLLQDFTTGKRLKICWDTGNGVAGYIMDKLVTNLNKQEGDQTNKEHKVLFSNIDGTFPNHHPDPTVEENLQALIKEVTTNKFDLGVAFDGDADRVGIVDNQGRIFWGDQILSILSREICEKYEDPTIIADVKASQVLFKEIARLGGNPVMWKTGHSLIKTKMAELEAPLAGEMSGHIFYKDSWYGFDDGIYAAIRFANIVVNSGKSAAALWDELPKTTATPEIRIDCDDDKKCQ